MKTLNDLSTKKKIFFLFLLLIIFGTLFYVNFFVEKKVVVDYLENGVVVCSETYINKELNSTPCPQNRKLFPEEKWYLNNYSINLKNLTLNLNLT